jgi:hypothetical protein
MGAARHYFEVERGEVWGLLVKTVRENLLLKYYQSYGTYNRQHKIPRRLASLAVGTGLWRNDGQRKLS